MLVKSKLNGKVIYHFTDGMFEINGKKYKVIGSDKASRTEHAYHLKINKEFKTMLEGDIVSLHVKNGIEIPFANTGI